MLEYLTKKEAAELLKVSVRTIDNLRKGGLPSHKIGQQIRFLETEIVAWVNNTQKTNG